jgi:hypothetical protein
MGEVSHRCLDGDRCCREGVVYGMAKERSVDEYLGFAQKDAKKPVDSGVGSSVAVSDHGAYEDSWYQVLKAKSDEDEAGQPGDDGEA